MPDDEAETFELYLHHVYNNEFACILASLPAAEVLRCERYNLAKLYVLCEKLQYTTEALVTSIYKVRADGQ
ncbi:hypothetical protein BU25DRAFT_408483 [Macroventuria anomochaeta]|uniref:Uncharacterized protein n=1 Tax=Macroventuria anomochaeta TaxID=301207 RepID=A0ACB6S9H1_9PLEO|nr:uncharacterized protein BU25DRAFT_408483 [Macroventuria anomochaeta]KAF2629874.1 hypothetical protein BU25DRAFT_408483 [Macroventuria anomochaeta]